jgi:hypothetical protein
MDRARIGERIDAFTRPRIVGIGLVMALVSGALTMGVADARITRAAQPSQGADSSPCEATRTIDVPQASPEELAAAGHDKLPLAPLSERVDLVAPPFSNPTNVTNPLFPISNLHSAILNGKVDGKPFKVETTLLPETRIVEWIDGQCVETLVSQYVAYLNGRIEEVALDFYAQADDGSVWYFGEDVFNYNDGVVEDLEGTWLAGKEGPAAMIMPADPKVGNVFLPENIPGFVFEEVTVKAVDQTVPGPHGPVHGAMVSEELHQDGSLEEKIFAPGYGEFFTGSGNNVEALALAVPTDVLPGPVPAELTALSNGADRIFAAVKSKNWKAAAAAAEEMSSAWKTYNATGEVAARLRAPMKRALRGLSSATGSRNAIKSRSSVLAVADAALDLQLQYRPPIEVDSARFDLWSRRVVVDAAAGDSARIFGDVAVLEWIRDRIAHGLDDVTRTRLDVQLLELRTNANDEDPKGAAVTARALRKIIAGL